MDTIQMFLLLCLFHLVTSEDQLFMDKGRRSRKQLKKAYERCRKRQHSDILSTNKIDNIDVTDLRRRSSFASLGSAFRDSKVKVVLWPEGKVPVKLEPGLTKAELSSLRCAMLYFQAYTCLTFIQKKKHRNYVYLMKTHKKSGCFTETIGMKGGRQILNLDQSGHCWQHGTIIHEMMHVLGFFHEQSRSDRDHHVVVHWNNIPKPLQFQYWTVAEMGFDHKNVGKYDFGSVMHYGRYLGFHLALSAKVHNGQYEKQTQNNKVMGQRIGPSTEDTKKLNLMYRCSGQPGITVRSDSRCGQPFGNSGCATGKCCNYENWCDNKHTQCYPRNGGTLDPRVRTDYKCGFWVNNAPCDTVHLCSVGWCIPHPTDLHISDDGIRSDYRCGPQFNHAPCTNQQCCTSYGWCDHDPARCARMIDPRIRSDYRCGSQFNGAPCDSKRCCNSDGWCDINRKNCHRK